MYIPDSNDVISDEYLIDAIGRGDVSAMELLYDRYSRPFFSLAYRVTASKQAAEDLVQAAFLAIWQNRSSYSREVGSVRSWLYSIMHYRVIDYLRRQRSRSKWREIPWEEVEYDEDLLVSPDPWEETWRSEQVALIREALQSLSEEQRRAIELAYFEGLTREEIAERCGIPVGTVKSRLHAALVKLQEAWSATPSLFEV